MRARFQHTLNELHVYCKLCNWLPCGVARALAKYWGRTAYYRWIYNSGNSADEVGVLSTNPRNVSEADSSY